VAACGEGETDAPADQTIAAAEGQQAEPVVGAPAEPALTATEAPPPVETTATPAEASEEQTVLLFEFEPVRESPDYWEEEDVVLRVEDGEVFADFYPWGGQIEVDADGNEVFVSNEKDNIDRLQLATLNMDERTMLQTLITNAYGVMETSFHIETRALELSFAPLVENNPYGGDLSDEFIDIAQGRLHDGSTEAPGLYNKRFEEDNDWRLAEEQPDGITVTDIKPITKPSIVRMADPEADYYSATYTYTVGGNLADAKVFTNEVELGVHEMPVEDLPNEALRDAAAAIGLERMPLISQWYTVNESFETVPRS